MQSNAIQCNSPVVKVNVGNFIMLLLLKLHQRGTDVVHESRCYMVMRLHSPEVGG